MLVDAPPIRTDGRLFQSRYYPYTYYPEVLATLVPSAIERRRFQRLSHLIADNQFNKISSGLQAPGFVDALLGGVDFLEFLFGGAAHVVA